MPTRPLTLTALAVSAGLTTACAASPPISKAAPPRLAVPAEAERPCGLAVLPDRPTLGDLEAAYGRRGAQIVLCDSARRMLLETLQAERRAIDDWLAGR